MRYIILIFLLFFSPTWCNGVAYYRGVRGCSTDDNNQRNNTVFTLPQVRNFSAKPDMILMENADEWDSYLVSPTPIIL